MSRYDVAFLACRILAVYFVQQAAVTIAQATVYANAGDGLQENWIPFAITMAWPATYVFSAAVLWFIAPTLSRCMLPRIDDSATPISADAQTILGVAFVVIGVSLFLDGVVDLCTAVWIDHSTRGLSGLGPTELDRQWLPVASKFLIGLLMVLGSGILARLAFRTGITRHHNDSQ